ncbi:Nonsense-mediated mRNA decay NMD3 family protein [Zostera marina]|uniref:60S ribosomal export protein NMD3 n=1 Tax=Zostera marina TaxID=29655 RepID=A0A0K9Q516_ZOSMR|nr:Nonsense-mediated mRNA decay NMD3 family protein [Zostera marina]
MENQGMFIPTQTVGSVLCCMCGVRMQPNAANMCIRCLRSQVDITEGLQKNLTILHCPECNTYLQPPSTWIKAELESKELLAFCIKRLKNMNTVKLVHAEFVWTEPHSKRIKVKIRIQKEAIHSAVLEQAYTVEYTQQEHMCDLCARSQADPDQWIAVVQLRQHVSHRRTFFYLEQLILKHGAALKAINIKEIHQGIDFFFRNRSHAVKFVDFLANVVPIKKREDKQLVSHDSKSNNFNYKYTFSVTICPICREDLICLPPKVSSSLGNLGPVVLCMKVSSNILVMDPCTLRSVYLDSSQYWRNPFNPLLNSRQLVEYIVLDIECEEKTQIKVGSTMYSLAYAQVARLSDFGNNDIIFTVKTHLGNLLTPGDYALGYDVYGANNNDVNIDKHKGRTVPDAILIKKSYEEKRHGKRGKGRLWKLKSLKMEPDNSKTKMDEEKRDFEYEQFLEDLEENPELRFNISLYRDKEEEMTSMADTNDDVPSIPMEEMLADLSLNDDEN